MSTIRCWLSCAVLFLSATIASADNWPQWRGLDGNGISKEAAVPTEWSESKNIAWSMKLPGMGGSTPVVWGDRIFLTSEDGKDIVLMCVGTDGTLRWKQKIGTASSKVRGDEGNGASASPSTDGQHVWAFCTSGDLVCGDMDGKVVWSANLQERYGAFKIQFGMHSTPLLDGDRLYLQLIHSGGAWVIALDKATGKEIWKVKRPSDGRNECEHSYASATLWRSGKDAVLIVHGNDYATGHDLQDGHEIWRVGGLNPKTRYNPTLRFIASPVAAPDLIVVPSAKNGPVVGLKPTAKGMIEAGNSQEQWRLPSNTPDVPSPLIHDGLVYLCSEKGFVICLDAKTGKVQYNQRIHSARYRASPVFAGGHIYLTARDGTITVIKPGPKFEQVAVNKLPDEVSASPAVANGRIYIRGFTTLFAIGAKEK